MSWSPAGSVQEICLTEVRQLVVVVCHNLNAWKMGAAAQYVQLTSTADQSAYDICLFVINVKSVAICMHAKVENQIMG